MWSIIVRKLTGRVKPQREIKAPSNRLDVSLKYGTLVVFQILELQMRFSVTRLRPSFQKPPKSAILYCVQAKENYPCQQ